MKKKKEESCECVREIEKKRENPSRTKTKIWRSEQSVWVSLWKNATETLKKIYSYQIVFNLFHRRCYTVHIHRILYIDNGCMKNFHLQCTGPHTISIELYFRWAYVAECVCVCVYKKCLIWSHSSQNEMIFIDFRTLYLLRFCHWCEIEQKIARFSITIRDGIYGLLSERNSFWIDRIVANWRMRTRNGLAGWWNCENVKL